MSLELLYLLRHWGEELGVHLLRRVEDVDVVSDHGGELPRPGVDDAGDDVGLRGRLFLLLLLTAGHADIEGEEDDEDGPGDEEVQPVPL